MPHPSVKTRGFHYSPFPSPTIHLDAKIHGPLSRHTPVSQPFLPTSPLLGPRSLPGPHPPPKVGPTAVINSSFDQLPNSKVNLDLFAIK